MKSLLFALFVFGVLVAVSVEQCIDQIDCPESMCCSGYPPFGGFCSNFTEEGGQCHVEDKTVTIFGDFYIGTCPCAEGLVCVHQLGKQKNDGVCQLPATAAPAPEDNPVDEPAVDEPAVDEPAVDEPTNDAVAE